MAWLSPTYVELRSVVSAAQDQLLLCSPFVGRHALDEVKSALGASEPEIEIWTRLNARDWISGATDVVALSEFVQTYDGRVRLSIRQSDHLHAKIVMADRQMALLGSANLTRGGFARNVEAAAVLSQPSIEEIFPLVADIRDQLSPVSLRDFYGFADRCRELERDRETVIELIQGEASTLTSDSPLITLGDFIRRLQSGEDSSNAQRILQIRFNLDESNRTGHLKQSFYAVQRFLRENSDLIPAVANSEDGSYALTDATRERWLAFFREHRDEHDDALDYSFEILRHVLPTNLGGMQITGGGAGTPFRLVWKPVALLLQDRL